MGWYARGKKQVDFVATLMIDQMAPPFPVQCFSLLLGMQKNDCSGKTENDVNIDYSIISAASCFL